MSVFFIESNSYMNLSYFGLYEGIINAQNGPNVGLWALSAHYLIFYNQTAQQCPYC